ncbi:MAG: hypothetical protein IT489_03970 [Gammaproteobacteria bacterium]|nr:hypothetical protein [Gammaproteobacteria bacterium]
MQIYVKEWPNRAATLYTETGEELCTFPGIDAALALCPDGDATLGDLLDRHDIGALRTLIDACRAV